MNPLLLLALFVVALLYASVGQAGGTGYVAVMGLAGFEPSVIKPTALALNILVSAIGCVGSWRRGTFTWRAAYPFAVLGLPFSILGGAIHLPQRLVRACGRLPVAFGRGSDLAYNPVSNPDRRASAARSPLRASPSLLGV
jgi:uncharacterized membrane protein YfcA